ncbi:hypothetical protein OY671_008585, partial [Metschnikowia pulcherrima]
PVRASAGADRSARGQRRSAPHASATRRWQPRRDRPWRARRHGGRRAAVAVAVAQFRDQPGRKPQRLVRHPAGVVVRDADRRDSAYHHARPAAVPADRRTPLSVRGGHRASRDRQPLADPTQGIPVCHPRHRAGHIPGGHRVRRSVEGTGGALACSGAHQRHHRASRAVVPALRRRRRDQAVQRLLGERARGQHHASQGRPHSRHSRPGAIPGAGPADGQLYLPEPLRSRHAAGRPPIGGIGAGYGSGFQRHHRATPVRARIAHV